MKPDREIFELACSRLCVQPSEAYFVGDGGYDELQGAASVGMRTIQAGVVSRSRCEMVRHISISTGRLDKRYSAVVVLDQNVDKGHGQSFAYHRVYAVVLSRFARWHSIT